MSSQYHMRSRKEYNVVDVVAAVFLYDDIYSPDDGVPIVAIDKIIPQLNQAHRDYAKEIIEFLQKDAMMAVLTDRYRGDFEKAVITEIQKDVSSNVGPLRYIRNIYTKNKRASDIAEKSKDIATADSMGGAGDKVSINFVVLSHTTVTFDNQVNAKWFNHYATKQLLVSKFLVYGHDDAGHLIEFITDKEELLNDTRISAKIKKIGRSKYHDNLLVHTLNYVKATK